LPTQVFQVVAKSSKAKGWQRAHWCELCNRFILFCF